MIKTILVPATGSDRDSAVFASALTVARAFAAHLEFLHVRPDAAATAVAMASDGGGATMVGGLINRLEEEASEREGKAKQLFQSFCEREELAVQDAPPGSQAPSAQWLREIGAEPYWVAEYGRTADLLVIGRPGEDEGVSLDTIEGALIDSGRPLLIPPAAPLTVLPETIAIAWKATPQAARALTAASPFLSTAKQVVVLTVAEDRRAPEEEADRLMAGLRRHGVPVSVRHLRPEAQSAADTLLSAAVEHAALLVMGGYGHSRLREWIFGGFTLRVLRGAEVPVLMAH
ncbi:MAG TPA: universal stress protein [Stellaceae bacterium]|jgi:nucleotide-binding universal stress UspA family protein|nr:universal stress protein [Stellaceae bacterium]